MIYKDERIAIFIDGPNFYAAAKKLELDVDYKALRAHFAQQGRLVCASYFTAINEAEEFQPLRPLLDFIQYNGWNAVTKPAREFIGQDGTRKIKGSIDVELTVDAMMAGAYVDHVILFSGNRDFCALVKNLQEGGTRVSVASSLNTSPAFIADDLRRQADGFIELDDLRDIIGRAPRETAAAAA